MTLSHLVRLLAALVAISSASVIISLDLTTPWLICLLGLVLMPLALLAPGLLQARLQSYRITAIISVFYAGFALTEIVARPEVRWLPGILLLSATALIALLILAIRQTPALPSSAAHPE